MVTVREKESVKILKKYTKKEIIDVIDPTLLLSMEDWNYVEKIYFTTPGIYERENEQNVDKRFCSLKSVGPAEFIALIRDAKAVCTDSFHGMAISIVYQKQFYIFERSMPDKHLWASSSRQRDLLEQSGIGDGRLIKSLKDLDALKEVDYHNVCTERYWNRAKSLIRNVDRKG